LTLLEINSHSTGKQLSYLIEQQSWVKLPKVPMAISTINVTSEPLPM